MVSPEITFETTPTIVWAILFSIAGLGFWIERRGGAVGSWAALIVILIALAGSNVGLLPTTSQVYSVVMTVFVSAAVPLLLTQANLFQVLRISRRLALAFVCAIVGVLTGVVVALLTLPPPQMAHSIAGAYAAGYVGGSVNYAAVAQASGLNQTPALAAAAFSASLVAATLYLTLLTLVGAVGPLRKMFAPMPADEIASDLAPSGGEPTAFSIALCAAYALGVVALGDVVQRLSGVSYAGILTVTALSVLMATFGRAFVDKLSGAHQVGAVLIFVFFATVGASADLRAVVGGDAFRLLGFAGIIILVHALVMIVLGRLLRLSLVESLLASNASILGPTTAAGMATSLRAPALVTPSLIIGIFGYAIGNFVGIGVALAVR